jgi:hypothetical protein
MVLPPCRKFGASLSFIMKRSLSVPSGASWIVKAGEVLPQALIPDHEKLALKAEASSVQTCRIFCGMKMLSAAIPQRRTPLNVSTRPPSISKTLAVRFLFAGC